MGFFGKTLNHQYVRFTAKGALRGCLNIDFRPNSNAFSINLRPIHRFLPRNFVYFSRFYCVFLVTMRSDAKNVIHQQKISIYLKKKKRSLMKRQYSILRLADIFTSNSLVNGAIKTSEFLRYAMPSLLCKSHFFT